MANIQEIIAQYKSPIPSLVTQVYSQVKDDSLEHAKIIYKQYLDNIYFSYKTPYNLIQRLGSESNTIRKNTRNLIETYSDDFAKYKTANIKKIKELKSKDENVEQTSSDIEVKVQQDIDIVEPRLKKTFEQHLGDLPNDILNLLFSFEPKDRDMKSVFESNRVINEEIAKFLK
jgi:hypothetical protein